MSRVVKIALEPTEPRERRRDAYRRIQIGLCDVLDVADALDPDTRQRLLAAARTISEAAHELRAAKD